jgi:hypothetical protein
VYTYKEGRMRVMVELKGNLGVPTKRGGPKSKATLVYLQRGQDEGYGRTQRQPWCTYKEGRIRVRAELKGNLGVPTKRAG